MRLKRFWRSPKQTTTSSEDSGGCDSPTKTIGPTIIVQQLQSSDLQSPPATRPTCSLPLLQVWPSQVIRIFNYFSFFYCYPFFF